MAWVACSEFCSPDFSWATLTLHWSQGGGCGNLQFIVRLSEAQRTACTGVCSRSGAILWAWALPLWDLMLSPSSRVGMELTCRTPRWCQRIAKETGETHIWWPEVKYWSTNSAEKQKRFSRTAVSTDCLKLPCFLLSFIIHVCVSP